MDAAADVVIDFSRAESLDSILDYSMAHRLPVDLFHRTQRSPACAAGGGVEQIPVFFSYNNSVGTTVITLAGAKGSPGTGRRTRDIEIVEKHHNKKVDAPSGTAVMLFNSLNETRDGALWASMTNQSVVAEREGKEVGIMSVRGGNIAGEHSVFFCGTDETIEIRLAYSEHPLAAYVANGALRAVF